ncbi:hypothetical protein K431DRAFT_274544 [Polychaeton citri CBS 116435]|uniref:Enoyl reductase (ER) domain-containing protein n=1 Tax=Polychaeton citri CBS 116435 TaxID=1314669 RepID=A0A9P4UN17_9PEZI|nr:hypothetical protein K431DRAFT_274544 [Polychaeton citri CBS 116435]
MHAAQITTWGQAPQWTEVPDLPTPSTSSPEEPLLIKILASGVHNAVRSKANGKHYSAAGAVLPLSPGIDGTGIISNPSHPDSGKAVYFASFQTGGTFADYIVVPRRNVILLPPGLDPVLAAAFVNPATSSWVAMRERTTALPKRFTVLVLGATSASGSLAVSLARASGAGRVIGAARSAAALAALPLDAQIVTDPTDPTKTDFSSLQDTPVDLVLDYVYGPLTLHFFVGLKSTTPTQYVHIGSLSGTMDIAVPGAVLRSKDLTIRGSGIGSFDVGKAFRKHIPGMLEAMAVEEVQGQLQGEGKVTVVPMEEIADAWDKQVEGRLVFVNN